MRALLRKAVADVLGRKGQSALILITVAAAAAMLYLGLVTLQAATAPYDKLMDRANGAHAWFLVSGGNDGLATAKSLAAQPGVQAAAGIRQWAERKLILPSVERVPTVLLIGRAADDTKVAGSAILEGRNLQIGDTDAAVLEASLSRYLNLKVGSQFKLSTPNGPYTLRLVGVAADPLLCQHPNCKPLPLYVTEATFNQLNAGSTDTGYFVGVRLTQPDQALAFATRKYAVTGESRIVNSMAYTAVKAGFTMTQGFSVMFVLVFGLLAVVTSAMITANIIGGAVINQYKEIGTLKVLGFTRSQILVLFSGQSMLLALLGGLLGTGVGHLASVRMMEPLAVSMGAANVLAFNPVLAALTIGGVTIISGAFALIASWRAGKVRPAQILNSGFSAPRARVPLAVRVCQVLRLPFSITLGVKDATARPGRAIMTILSLVLSLVTISMSVSLTNLIDRLQNDPEIHGVNYDLEVDRQFLTGEEVEAKVQANANVAAYYSQAYTTGALTNQDTKFTVRAIGGNWTAFRFPVIQGRMLKDRDEVLLAPGAMDQLKLTVGDKVNFTIENQTHALTVVGVYRDPNAAGLPMLMTLETLRAFNPKAAAEVVRVKAKEGADLGTVRDSLLSDAGYRVTVERADKSLPSYVTDLMKLLVLLSCLMAAIAALSVLNTALLNAREQMKEIGIRKAVGMTPAQILIAVGATGLWLGLWGALVGVPSGLLLNDLLVQVLGQAFNLGSLNVAFPGTWLSVLVASGVALAIAASMPAALWAARLVTAEALHAE